MHKNIGNLERVIGLLRDISSALQDSDISDVSDVSDVSDDSLNKKKLFITNPLDHGGFVFENVKSYFKIDFLEKENNEEEEEPIKVLYINSKTLEYEIDESLLYVLCSREIPVLDDFFNCYPILHAKPLTSSKELKELKELNDLEESRHYLYVAKEEVDNFMKHFHYYFENGKFKYDNLIHLCMIVKNAGEQFRETLQANLPFIDRWTILDTGSTDNTVNIIEEVLVGKKKGTLHRGSFVNFRETRNECLELAGYDNCKFNVMLDDTYRLKGKIRECHYLKYAIWHKNMTDVLDSCIRRKTQRVVFLTTVCLLIPTIEE
jgi:hypothetical protein